MTQKTKFKTKPQEEVPHVSSLLELLSGHNGFIAGGCFKDIFGGHRIKDVDIFFLNKSDLLDAARYFMNVRQWSVEYENKNAIAFKSPDGYNVELIKAIYGTPEVVLSQFDFTVSKFALSSSDYPVPYVTYHVDFFDHIITKQLVFDEKIPYPASTLDRVCRYALKGFRLDKENVSRLIDAIRDNHDDDGLYTEDDHADGF
ncbi:MAG: hypothetical protein ACRDD8_05850 [Bacteroidales bacterium]